MATPIGVNDKGGNPPMAEEVWGPDGGLKGLKTGIDPVLAMVGITNQPEGMTPGHVNAETPGNRIRQ